MQYELYYLPFAGYDDNGDPEPEREMSGRMQLNDHTPSPEEIDDLWVKQTEGELDGYDSDEEALSHLWNLYNRGPDGYHPEMDEKEMRSLSKNDIVILDGTAYLCESFGWSEIEMGSGE